ncbi:MAG: type II secretion system protein [Gemmataceae bacterium]
MKTRIGARGAFTLLELLIVVAILAILAGGLVVSYGGLDEQAGHGVDANNSAAVDRAVRLFASLHSQHPDGLDSLMINGTPALLNRLNDAAKTHFVAGTLTGPEVTALGTLGLTTVFDVDAAAYDTATSSAGNSSAYPNHPTMTVAANNIFQVMPAGLGVQRTLAAGGPAILLGADPVLRTKLRLDANDNVAVFGLSRNSTMGDQSRRGALSTMPFGRVGRGEYGRFFLLFRVSNSADATAAPYFVGVLDPHGHTLDDAYDEYQKGTR